jgi:hypothetical protein
VPGQIYAVLHRIIGTESRLSIDQLHGSGPPELSHEFEALFFLLLLDLRRPGGLHFWCGRRNVNRFWCGPDFRGFLPLFDNSFGNGILGDLVGSMRASRTHVPLLSRLQYLKVLSANLCKPSTGSITLWQHYSQYEVSITARCARRTSHMTSPFSGKPSPLPSRTKQATALPKTDRKDALVAGLADAVCALRACQAWSGSAHQEPIRSPSRRLLKEGSGIYAWATCVWLTCASSNPSIGNLAAHPNLLESLTTLTDKL